MAQSQRFAVLEGRFAICRLAPGSPLPPTPESATLWALTITSDEISLVCDDMSAPRSEAIERTWRAIKIVGPLDFSLQGVLLSLLGPLSEMQMGVFVLSTFDTDYILVKEFDLTGAIQALEQAGHTLEQ